MEQKLSDTLVKAIDRSNPMMQNLQLASRFNKLVEEGGGADLEDNHEVSITENGEIEITPAEGKDGMKKVTATVNVSEADLEDNKQATIDVSTYTDPVEITPTQGKDGMKKVTVSLSNIPSGSGDPMSVSFKGWKGLDDNNRDVYIGFLKDDQWITDKSVLDTYFNQDEDHFVFDTSVFDFCVYRNSDTFNLFTALLNSNSTPPAEYEFEFYTAFPDFFVTTDTEYSGDLFISSSSEQMSWLIKNWSSVEFVESLPLMTYTPSN